MPRHVRPQEVVVRLTEEHYSCSVPGCAAVTPFLEAAGSMLPADRRGWGQLVLLVPPGEDVAEHLQARDAAIDLCPEHLARVLEFIQRGCAEDHLDDDEELQAARAKWGRGEG